MVQVEITEGLLEGVEIEDDIAGKFYSFKGIPYAAPPVGDLRFKEPQPVKPWKGVKKAKEFGPICYQMDALAGKIVGSEDCLYLNVYTPEIKPKEPLPVMVWIHGGSFLWGNGNDDLYGPEFLVKQGVILVTLNYRLGVLGFLCLDSEDVPGNAGMKDQVAALRWVQKNISNFGGDPDNVTIFGESAGGMSVSYHLISPMTKGLFKRAISQSGVSTCFTSRTFEPLEMAKMFAKKLGLYSEDKNELYEFFKTQPLENFINYQIMITSTQAGKGFPCFFSIVDEQDHGSNEQFFIGDPYDVLRNNGIHEGVDVITGYTEDEGVFIMKYLPELTVFLEKVNYLCDTFTPDPITDNCSAKQRVEVGRRVKKYYFGDQQITLEHLEQMIKYFSMHYFIYPTVQWAKLASSNSNNNKVFLYRFGCKSERNLMSTVFGVQKLLGDKVVVCHADDLPYIFPAKMAGLKIDNDSESYKLIENVTTLWTNFAKFGHPTPDDNLWVKWLPYNAENEKYLDLGNQLRVRSHPDAEQVKFWEDIFKEFYPRYAH